MQRSLAKVWTKLLITGGIFIVFPNAAVPQSSPKTIYVVVPVTTTLKSNEKIGRKKAGLVCLPNGTLDAQDIKVGLADSAKGIIKALSNAGLTAVSSDDFAAAPSERAAYSVRWLKAVVTGADFNVCAKKWGMGDRQRVSGKAALAVAWSVREGPLLFSDKTWSDQSVIEYRSDQATSLDFIAAAGVVHSLHVDNLRD